MKAPPGAVQVTYSQTPKLVGWLSTNPPGEDPGIKRPAIVFLHGGFALSREDWDMAKPYRDAGYIVFMPALRGENGQPGEYSMFYNEVNDVVAALDFVLKRPNLSHRQVYLAGHSVGGTLALLTAMSTDKAKAAVSFSAAPDVQAWSKGQPEVIPFNPSDEREFEIRSPQSFPGSFKAPVRLYYGDREEWCRQASDDLVAVAKDASEIEISSFAMPGDHFTAVAPAMQSSLKFFQVR